MPNSQLIIFLVEWMGVVAVTLLLSLSPAFKTRRPVKFVFARREVIIALALFVAITAFLGFVVSRSQQPILPPVSLALTNPRTTFVYTPDDLLRQAALTGAMLIPFLLALAIRRQPLLSAGLSRRVLKPGLQLGAALALITIFLTNKTYSILYGLSTSQGIYLVAMLVVAFVEEFIFRGYIQLRLMDWLGETWGWIATAVLFVVWQLPQRLLVEGGTLADTAIRLGVMLVFGLLLGWIMRRSGSVLATTLFHAAHNWIMVL
ncbi:MAG TPA: CPBP family intramembrane glutamic endopeptidase [Anaerolineaceae bacterium]|jgi:membrane protease YdiL (CAAX protease family)